MLYVVLVPEVLLPGHNLCEVGDSAGCLWILQSGEWYPHNISYTNQAPLVISPLILPAVPSIQQKSHRLDKFPACLRGL